MKKMILILLALFVFFIIILGVVLSFTCNGEDELRVLPELFKAGEWADTPNQLLKVWAESEDEDPIDPRSEGSFITDYYFVSGFSAFSSTRKWADPGTYFVIIDVTVTNKSNRSIKISPDDFTLYDSMDNAYYHAGYSGKRSFPDTNLGRGQTDSGKIAFLVPDFTSGFRLTCPMQDVEERVLTKWELPW